MRVPRRASGRIQCARLTTMNGRSSSHRAREALPEVRLHHTYASGTGLPRWSPGRDSASASSARRYTAAVSSPVIRTVRGSSSISWGVVPPTPWTRSSSAVPAASGPGPGLAGRSAAAVSSSIRSTVPLPPWCPGSMGRANPRTHRISAARDAHTCGHGISPFRAIGPRPGWQRGVYASVRAVARRPRARARMRRPPTRRTGGTSSWEGFARSVGRAGANGRERA